MQKSTKILQELPYQKLSVTGAKGQKVDQKFPIILEQRLHGFL